MQFHKVCSKAEGYPEPVIRSPSKGSDPITRTLLVASPDDDLVSDLQEGLDDGDLGGHLGASDDGNEGLLGVLDSS